MRSNYYLPQLILYTILLSCISFLPAHAYKRTLSPQGDALYWEHYPIPFYIHRAVPSHLAAEPTYLAIRQSFQAWAEPECTCLRFEDKGLTDDTQLGYNQKEPSKNQNIVIFVMQSWKHASNAVAVTSTTFNEKNGEIVGYDIEINAVNFLFSLDAMPIHGSPTMDIQNTITHEIGHVIGLDHSNVGDSTMFASGPVGETKKRTLHQDDLDGLCDIYPKNRGCPLKQQLTQPEACGCSTSNRTSLSLLSMSILLSIGLGLIYRLRCKTRPTT